MSYLLNSVPNNTGMSEQLHTPRLSAVASHAGLPGCFICGVGSDVKDQSRFRLLCYLIIHTRLFAFLFKRHMKLLGAYLTETLNLTVYLTRVKLENFADPIAIANARVIILERSFDLTQTSDALRFICLLSNYSEETYPWQTEPEIIELTRKFFGEVLAYGRDIMVSSASYQRSTGIDDDEANSETARLSSAPDPEINPLDSYESLDGHENVFLHDHEIFKRTTISERDMLSSLQHCSHVVRFETINYPGLSSEECVIKMRELH
ncbi:hypothetical protein DL93DRAFT_1333225 [Clavulina sp. PMI_390]|nr:hypothetical protein DL93DRAFT_1333225 [Clavulina sp. PMI_390]